jgi:peptide/nickel transport system permease protein
MAAQSLDMQDVAMNGTRANPNSAFRRLLAVIRELLGNPSSGFGLVVITILVLTAIVAPLIAPYDPNVIDLGNTLKPPSAEHWCSAATSSAASSTARASA